MYFGLPLVLMCVCLAVSAIGQEQRAEPKCSSFDFQEKTLHKLIRLEFTVEQTVQAMKSALSDMKSEVVVMQGERDSMQAEVDAIKRERNEMKSQIASELKTQVDSFKAAQDSVTEKIHGLERNLTDVVSTPTILFMAKDPTDSSPASGQIIVYSTVLQNVGGGYDATTGKFTAPVRGLYEFTLHACSQGSQALYYVIRTDKSVLVQGRLYDGNYPCSSATVYRLLEIGGDVWVTVSVGGSHSQIHMGNDQFWNTFSGILVHT